VQGLVVFDQLLTFMPLAALLAFAQAWGRSPGARPGATNPRPGPAASPLLAAAASGALVVVAAGLNWPTWRSSQELLRGVDPLEGQPLPLGDLKAALDAGGFGATEIREKLLAAAALVASRSEAADADQEHFLGYAIDQADQELAARPHEVRIRLGLARLYEGLGDRPQAMAEISSALTDAPHHPLLLDEAERLGVAPRRAAD
jgi:hypothetical protein